MEKDYIQLPPLPADTSVKIMGLIWQFTKLGECEQKEVCDYLENILEGSDMKETKEKFSRLLDADGVVEGGNLEVAEFAKLMRQAVGELVTESCELSAFVYQQYCVGGKSLCEIARESKLDENILCLIAQYYDRK